MEDELNVFSFMCGCSTPPPLATCLCPATHPMRNTGVPLDPAPYNLTLMKGVKSFQLPRHFVHFLLHHPVAQTFLNWSRDMFIPEETAFQTLATVSNVRLLNNNEWVMEQDMVPLSVNHLQFSIWNTKSRFEPGFQCHGQWRNNVCVWSLLDLPFILSQNKLVVNKFRSDMDSSVVPCLVEMVGSRASTSSGATPRSQCNQHSSFTITLQITVITKCRYLEPSIIIHT